MVSHEPADSYWYCGNQEGMESRADDVESQGVGMAGKYRQQTKEKITDEENEGNGGWMSDSEFQLRLPNHKHATNLPLPIHRPSGALTSSSAT